ncbi:uncharacterized protein ACLA_039350 [Aspergillus clavatus NRRL 1]|uniref:DUF6594 domain-containing protein n=1 Tax=Aspergillus clavatus (strain ATCC 1007 / CBS 513.65 / DSM 816 / NCTC 3887 / NRRL 1 / QM 1276 / 107) TaxID=344612 RepID=A1CKP6_ASPCL|nr:uncharacterized protein ACLA_039350 [Aspergillus clavatus NRRL 1]EAW09720.1 conserved hypothetical protein [Aspergillus clavatus NRRL 1]
MPFYSSSSRSKKSNRSSAGSVLSMASKTTSKGSKSSVEKKALKEDIHLSPGAQKKDEANIGSSQRPQDALDPKLNAEKGQKPSPNVFEYLDEDTSSEDESSSEREDVSAPSAQASKRLRMYSRPTNTGSNVNAHINTMFQPQEDRRASIRSQTSSKSKTPVNARQLYQADASPRTVSPQLLRSNATHKKVSLEEAYRMPGTLADSVAPGDLNLDLTTLPETYHPSRNPTTHRPPLPPSPPRSPRVDLHRTPNSKRSRRNTKSSHIPLGYGILSNQLSSSSDSKEPHLPPLYRRFEDLNHRVLLYLQDEIAQMEEDLRVLDEYEEMHRIATAEQEGTKKMPASRRMDAQAQVYSSLHYRRIEVMGALIQKTEQYNNALAAYSKVVQTLPRASDKDIDTYRTWMKENSPIVIAESRFLDHGEDLVSLTPGRAAHSTPVYSAIIIASAAILLPLLTFSMIAEFSGRLLVVALVGGAASIIATSYSAGAEHLVESRDGWRSAMLYFGFMTVAALFIP